ncbi:hypothetical protein GCM10028778_22130 [Barrientosiimonas marina]|uniref:Uncharacterized protein n=1 Tax=Lentibacillus kimchii TaxID=1542911 RepID=A0ABW2UU38_9BACI
MNVITAPEIEMLIIHAEDCYDDYSKKGLKPSDYVKQQLKMSNIKNYNVFKDYFSDIDKLKNAIRVYHSKTKYKDSTIYQRLIK